MAAKSQITGRIKADLPLNNPLRSLTAVAGPFTVYLRIFQ